MSSGSCQNLESNRGQRSGAFRENFGCQGFSEAASATQQLCLGTNQNQTKALVEWSGLAHHSLSWDEQLFFFGQILIGLYSMSFKDSFYSSQGRFGGDTLPQAQSSSSVNLRKAALSSDIRYHGRHGIRYRSVQQSESHSEPSSNNA